MFSYLLAFSAALIASLLATPMVRELAKSKGWVDRPDGKRKLHKTPTPRLGGAGIYFALLAGLAPVLFLSTDVAAYVRSNSGSLVEILAFSGMMMLIGLWDDLKSVAPWKRFAAQSFVALLCWFAGFRILHFWAGDHVHLWWAFSIPLTILWIVGITNAFNLIDGMDGLAAGASLFATLALLVVSVKGDLLLTSLLLFALSGATLGFLRYNFNPATIFLGDSGSYLLGFALAVLSIRGSQKSTAAYAIAVPIVALGLPMLDTGLAIARRFVRGKPIFSGDRRHIHHVLLNRGLAPKHAVIVLYGISGLFGLISLCFINPSNKTNGVILAILGACIWFGIQQLRYSEMHGLKGYVSRGLRNQRKLLAGSVVVGQLVEELRKSTNLDEFMQSMGAGLDELCFSRFELTLRNDGLRLPINPERQWTAVPIGLDSMALRWTSPCFSCWSRQKTQGARQLETYLYPENEYRTTCAECERLKNPILQKGIMKGLVKTLKMPSEYRIAFPLNDKDGSYLGEAQFYHPIVQDYPISVISVLNQNLWMEMEKTIQNLLNAVGERHGFKLDLNLNSFNVIIND